MLNRQHVAELGRCQHSAHRSMMRVWVRMNVRMVAMTVSMSVSVARVTRATVLRARTTVAVHHRCLATVMVTFRETHLTIRRMMMTHATAAAVTITTATIRMRMVRIAIVLGMIRTILRAIRCRAIRIRIGAIVGIMVRIVAIIVVVIVVSSSMSRLMLLLHDDHLPLRLNVRIIALLATRTVALEIELTHRWIHTDTAAASLRRHAIRTTAIATMHVTIRSHIHRRLSKGATLWTARTTTEEVHIRNDVVRKSHIGGMCR